MSTATAAPYHLAAGEGRPMSWFTAAFERMFELAPTTPAEAVGALARYDVAVVGPHPRDAAAG